MVRTLLSIFTNKDFTWNGSDGDVTLVMVEDQHFFFQVKGDDVSTLHFKFRNKLTNEVQKKTVCLFEMSAEDYEDLELFLNGCDDIFSINGEEYQKGMRIRIVNDLSRHIPCEVIAKVYPVVGAPPIVPVYLTIPTPAEIFIDSDGDFSVRGFEWMSSTARRVLVSEIMVAFS